MTDLYQVAGFDLTPKALNLPGEEWRELPDHPSYQVSNLGRARKHVGNLYDQPIYRIHNVFPVAHGGVMFIIYGAGGTTPEGKRKDSTRRLAKAVLEVFGFPRIGNQDVYYRDGNDENCSLANIHWGPRRSYSFFNKQMETA